MAIQLEDFARQVLFGTTIEEKLSFPREEILDTKRSGPIKTPKTLSRPAHLQLREEGVKAAHPAEAKLVDERERGRLLHFFGNHELLATELMALAILKFPDAPASFRRGLLETLKDEQVHTRMYMHRMGQCGVAFGELPLGDYFWRSVSSMEDPLDYVTRLSLTFEQANLDYSREYGRIFNEVGDRATGAILDKIYRDEIDHVGFGLKWFRRWKAEGKTDWEVFRERLAFPLSPARAKGSSFNREGRDEVGFDSTFIDSLQVFSQSRGRTPDVYWFNSSAEASAAGTEPENFNEAARSVQEDLSLLPAYLSRKDDLLLTTRPPSQPFLKRLHEAGFDFPEVVAYAADATRAPDLARKIGRLRPWAWTPESVSFFRSALASGSKPQALEANWDAPRKLLFSKAWSSALGARLAVQGGSSDKLAPAEVYGKVARSEGELLQLRSELADMGYRDLALKAPFGTAGQGMRRWLGGEAYGGGLKRWVESILAQQGELVVEPWLQRVFDYSMQLHWDKGVPRIVGYARLINTAGGQFSGIVSNAFCKGLDGDLVQFLMHRVEGRPWAYFCLERVLLPELQKVAKAINLSGPMGIDAFVYRSKDGSLLLKPLVEINPRYTMGRVGLELARRNAAISAGFFQILNQRHLKSRSVSSFADYASVLSAEYPVALSDERVPRIVEGSLPLTDPGGAKRFLAVYHVRRTFAELPVD